MGTTDKSFPTDLTAHGASARHGHSAKAASDSPLAYRALEQRIAFDAAMAVAVDKSLADAAAAPDTAHPVDQTAAAQPLDAAKAHALASVLDTSTAGSAVIATPAEASRNVVFIDGAVQDPLLIAAAAPARSEIVVIAPGRDALAQMASYLSGRSDVGAIHIISHGAAGELMLGNTIVTEATLDSHASDLATIGRSLTKTGDILLYGCDVAQGDKGQAFIDKLASLTNAVVAASTDETGAATGGGDWTLEASTGQVLAPTIAAPDWQGELNTVITAATSNANVTSIFNNSFVGPGITANNQTQVGSFDQFGTFINDSSGLGLSKIPLSGGIVMVTGKVTSAASPAGNTTGGSSTTSAANASDADLAALSGNAIYDAAGFSFSFKSTTDRIGFIFSFASEEYPEYVASQFNDAFGFFIQGGTQYATKTDLALVPGKTEAIAVNTINGGVAGPYADGTPWDPANSSLYINNTGAAAGPYLQFDGLTNLLTVSGDVTRNTTYSMKVAIGDAGDASWDSGVFFKPNGFLALTSATDNTYTTSEASAVSGNVVTDDTGQNVDITPTGDQAGITVTAVNGTALGSSPITLASGSTLTMASDGTFTFTPSASYKSLAAGQTATESFTYTITDSTGITDTATVTMTILGANDAPSGTNKTITTLEDTAHVFAASDFGFSDPNSNALQAVEITTLPTDGALTDNGVAVSAGQFASAADIASGKLVWTPDTNANGSAIASLTFQVQDNGGTANGGVNLDPTPNTITVAATPVNDAPAGADNTITTNEDTGYTFTGSDFGFSDPNDSPANALLAVKMSTLPANGTLTDKGIAVSAGQFVSAADIAAGKLIYTPDANANGSSVASFKFQVQDTGGTANGGVDTDPTPNTLAFDVTPVNDAPAGADKAVTTREDTAYVFTAADFGFTDPADSPANALLAVKISTLPVNGTLTDNGVAVSAGQFVSAADIAGDKLVFTPAADATGSAIVSFTFQVQDDGGTANGGADTDPTPNTITFNVTPVNDAPSGADNTVTTLEDTGYTFKAADFGFTDPNDSPANALQAVEITTLPLIGTLTDNGVTVVAGQLVSAADIVAGRLVFTSAANANGDAYANFTFQVQDNGGTANGGIDLDPTPTTITFNVTPVNDPPVDGSEIMPVTEDTTLFVPASSGLLSNTYDVDGGAPTVTGFTVPGLPGTPQVGSPTAIPNVGTIFINADGSFIFTPAIDFTGIIPVITYTVSDGHGGTATSTLTLDMVPVNDPPVAVNDTATGTEDHPVAVDVLANDHDVDSAIDRTSVVITSTLPGSSLAADGKVLSVPGEGTWTVDQTTGVITFAPVADYNGSPTPITYTVKDTSGAASNEGTVSLTLAPVDDAPTQHVPAAFGPGNEDTTIALAGITVADIDSAAVTTTLAVNNGKLHIAEIAGLTVTGDGTCTLTLSGSPAAIDAALAGLTFTPGSDFNGNATVSVSTTDGIAAPAVATSTIAVAPVQDIADDSVTTNEGVPVTFAPFANDTFENPDHHITAIDGAAIAAGGPGVAVTGGSVTLDTAGNLTFTPDTYFHGSPSFTYSVTSGGTVETATVDVTVLPVNHTPTQSVPGAQVLAEDTFLVISGTSVADVDGGTITTTLSVPAGTGTLSVVAGSGATISSNGSQSVTISGTAAEINAALTAITFHPVSDYYGPAPLTISSTDGLATTSSTIAITVDPVADATNDALTTNENATRAFNVLTGAYGATADSFDSPAAFVSGVTQPANGAVTFMPDGSIKYTPATNFSGTDTFTYTVTSGGVQETATVTIAVDPVNVAPTQSVPGPQAALEDTNIVFGTANGNAITVADVDSPLTTKVSVANGTLTLGSLAGVAVTGNGSSSVTVSGSAAAINAALEGLAFAPTPDWNGSTTLAISSTDGVSPPLTDTVAIITTPVVDIAPDALATAMDTARVFNVLANDSFEGATAAITGVTQPEHGTVTIGTGGNVTYTPDAGYNGGDSFTYTVTSGGVTETATVSIAVGDVSHASAANLPPAQYSTEDTPIVFSGTTGNKIIPVDTTAGGSVTTTLSIPAGTLTAVPTTGVLITGNGSDLVTLMGSPTDVDAALNGLHFAPAPDANGTVNLSVVTTDGIDPPVTGTIAINLAPVADIKADAAATIAGMPKIIDVLANDTFQDPARTISAVTDGAHGTVAVNPDGTVTYTPQPGFVGTDNFTYTVASGGVTETANVTVLISAGNDVPAQFLPPAQQSAEDAGLMFSSATGNAITIADPSGSTLATTLSVTNGIISLGSVIGVTVTGDGTGIVTISGSQAGINVALDGLSYIPNADYNGTAAMSVTTTNGTSSASGIITLAITPVVDIADHAVTTGQGVPVTFNVMSNDAFEDPAAAISAVTQPAHGTVTVGSAGQVTYTPALGYSGADSFTYTATSGGVTETATVDVGVDPIVVPFTASLPTTVGTSEDTAVVFSVGNNDALTFADPNGGTLTATLSATNGQLTLGSIAGVTVFGNGTGTIMVSGSAAALNAALDGLSFAPTADYNGFAAITVTSTDGSTTVDRQIIVTVAPVADIVADTVSTSENVPVTVDVLANDSFESAGASVTGVTQGTSGAVSFLADGTVAYKPNPNFHGTDAFTYTVTSGGVTETTTVSVTVGAVEIAPTTSGHADRNALDGQIVSVPVASSFADVDGLPLAYSATGLPPGLSIDPATGIISGTIDPSASQSGPYTVVVSASDGNPGGTCTASFDWAITNPAPTAHNDTATTSENLPMSIAVLGNDTDPDADPLTVTAGTAANGAVVINPDGSISYTPVGNFTGTDTIVYEISDGNGGRATATVTVTVAPVNIAPTTTGLPDLIDSDSQHVGLNIADAFSDLNGDTLTYTINGLPPGLSYNPATGDITGTLAPSTSAPTGDHSYPVSITANDGHGGTVTASFTWSVVNTSPMAADDTVITAEDTPVIATVLANDSDPADNPLTITEINGVPVVAGGSPVGLPHGTVELQVDGSGNQVLVYTPKTNFNGTETLTYTTSNGIGGSDTATLTIDVTPQNHAPTATALADLASSDGDAVSVDVGSFFHDSDVPNGDHLAFSALGLPPGLGIDPSTGVISGTIDPSASQSGPYAVSVSALDTSGATVSETFTWAVANPAPTAHDDAGTTSENTILSKPVIAGVLANDPDPDHDTLTVGSINADPSLVGAPVAGSAGGTFVIKADGSYTFDPGNAFNDLQAGESRSTTVSYAVSDGNGGTSTATLTVTVDGVDNAPVSTTIAPIATKDGAPLTLDAGKAFSDVEGDSLTYSVSGLPAGFSMDPATGIVSGTLDSSASQGGAGGVYSVTVTADDGHGGTTPVTFTITATNPPPVAADDAVAVVEDTPVSSNVLTNDVDPDGDALAVTHFTVAGLPGGFNPGDTATIAGVGTVTIATNGEFSFDPAANYNGPVPDVTYTVQDADGATDTAVLSLGPIAAVHDSPASTPIPTQSRTDGASVALDLAPSFSDVDGVPLTFSIDPSTQLPPGLAIDPSSGLISGTIDHLSSANGPYAVTVIATDPSGASTSQTFTWDVTNPAPVAPTLPDLGTVDSAAVSLAAGAGFSDPDGDALTFSASGLPSGLAIDPATGLVTGTLSSSASTGGPASDGIYAITVTATDSQGASVSKTFDYTVTNPAPIAVNDTVSGLEDTPITGSVAGNDVDPDGDAVTFAVKGDPAHGTVVMQPDGSFTYTPDLNYNATDGRDTFTYTITDANGASATATVTLTVMPVNDAPTAPDVTVTTLEDTPFTGTLIGADVDGDLLSFSKASEPQHGTAVVLPDGTYTYTPALNYNGADSFTYTVADGNGGTVTKTVTIGITPVNDAPVANDDARAVSEDGPAATGSVTANDTDVESDPLTVAAASQNGTPITIGTPFTVSGGGVLTLKDDGSYTFDPGTAYNGLALGKTATETVSYTISDGNGGTATATLVITVDGANDAPVVIDPANPGTTANPIPAPDTVHIVPDVATTDGATPAPVDVGHYIVDPDGEPLTFSATGLPPGLAIDPATGIISGTLPADASKSGPYTVVVTATDPHGAATTTEVVYAVANLPPVAVDDTGTVSEDGPAATGNLLANDHDTSPDSDPLTVAAASQNGTPITIGTPFTVSGGGVLTLKDDGSYTFDPGTAYNGLALGKTATETVSYTISDGNGGTATATLVITVDGANDAPVVIDPANPGTTANPIPAPDTAHIVPDVATTDGATPAPVDVGHYIVDPDGEPLTFSATGLPPGLAIDPATGIISGTLPADASKSGPYTVVVTAADPNGAATTTEVVYAVANLPPVAVDDTGTVSEDGPAATGNLLANDHDTSPDSDPLTVAAASQNGTPITIGTPFTVSGGGVLTLKDDGSYTFDPGTAYNGLALGKTATETVSYTISDDNGGTATATLVITVDGANDAPVVIDPANPGTTANPIPAPDTVHIVPDVATTDGATPAPVDVGHYIVDPDGEPLTFSATGLPPGLAIDPATGIISGTLPADASKSGPYTVVVTATDPHGAATTTEVVYAVANLPPVAVDDTGTVETGRTVTIDVLANDHDTGPDHDPLKVVAAVAEHGVVTINPDGTISYVANPGYDGNDTITYRISDGNGGFAQAKVHMTVIAIPVPLERPIVTEAPPSVIAIDQAIAVDGIVVDTVRSLDGGQSILVDGIVLDAVRGVGHNQSVHVDGIVVDTVDQIWQRERIGHGGVGSDLFDTQGLSKFSLELSSGSGTASTGLQATVRDGTLTVALAFDPARTGRSLMEWKIQRADGRPLPDWVAFQSSDEFRVDAGAHPDRFALRIVGILDDGSSVSHEVRIDPVTGEMQPLKIGRSGAIAPKLFWEQLGTTPRLTEEQGRLLARKLAG